MAKPCMVASLMSCRNLIVILARFWSGHHGQILPGSITSDLPEPYGNLGKILVSLPLPNLTFKSLKDYGQITLAKFLHAGTSSDLTRFCHVSWQDHILIKSCQVTWKNYV